MTDQEHTPLFPKDAWSFRFDALSEQASEALADDISKLVEVGDILALDGDLGLGKSTFARALLRAKANNPFLEVPSPTFTLVQSYEMEDTTGALEISHFDLYRISDFEELYEIGLEESWVNGCALIEWPDRAEDMLPAHTLWLHLKTGKADEARCLTLVGDQRWGDRLQRICEKRQLLITSGWGDGIIHSIEGDLSPRQYDRVKRVASKDEEEITSTDQPCAILMDMPERAPGPLLPDGRFYDTVAHRVTSLAPMVSISEGLAELGLRVPTRFGVDLRKGLMLWEDFGKETLAGPHDHPHSERYLVTVSALAALHSNPTPQRFDGAGGTHILSRYDQPAFEVELDVFIDHYWPHIKGADCPAELRLQFQDHWRPLLSTLTKANQALVLRDVQDPNCFWLANEGDTGVIGFIDFQDCLIGPSAYDLAALAMDARVTIPPLLERKMLSHYQRLMNFDDQAASDFEAVYCVCAAQRISKNLGAFARAAHQAERPHYLNHIPRSVKYLTRAMEHPLLVELKGWYESHNLLTLSD